MREQVGISIGQLQITVGVIASSFRRSNESFGICPLPLEEMGCNQAKDFLQMKMMAY
jgi:hypothetical protein